MAEKLDIILFGVTGLVGRFGVQHLHKLTREKEVSWGVAGRDRVKIQKVLTDLEKSTGDDTISSRVPIILADMSDEASIIKMTSRTKVLLNACGPLLKTGEVVVKSCIRTGTHYIDASAEDIYMGKLILNYSEKAKEAGVYVLNGCAFNNLMFEMGAVELQKRFPGTLNSIEFLLKPYCEDPTIEGPMGNSATWRSAIDLFLDRAEGKEIKKKLKFDFPPVLGPKLKTKLIPFKPEEEDGWAIHLHSTDRSTVLRTQQHFYEEKQSHPLQVETYIVFNKFKYIFQLILALIMFVSLIFFKAGRWLLLRYPKFFSFGFFDRFEPSKEKSHTFCTRLTCIGKGWKGRKLKYNEKCNDPTDYSMTLLLKCNNAGYGIPALGLVTSGLMVVTEESKIPKKYGVTTPGIAFSKTSMIDILKQNGVTFEIIGEKDI